MHGIRFGGSAQLRFNLVKFRESLQTILLDAMIHSTRIQHFVTSMHSNCKASESHDQRMGASKKFGTSAQTINNEKYSFSTWFMCGYFQDISEVR